jgi:ribose 1,5-bisphosphokinase PhnN
VAHGLTARSLVAWSPEGTVLAWQAGRMVMSAQVHQGTVSGQQTVAERDGALALIWSPDGQSLAAPSSAGLLLISADGAHVRANDSRATSNGQFSWSVAG